MKIENKQTLLVAIAIVATISMFVLGIIRNNRVAVDQLIGISYKVHQIGVISGHEFDIKLENGRRIHASLDIKTVPEAKKLVVRTLNNAQDPRVEIIGKDDSGWRINLYVKVDGSEEVNFDDWLRRQGVVWE